MPRVSPPLPALLAALFLASGLAGLPGCSGRSVPTDPAAVSPTPAAGPVGTAMPGESRGRVGEVLLDATWTVIAEGVVLPLLDSVLSGSRYTLDFPSGSLLAPTIITISERDPGLCDVEFGPDGTVFQKPVRVTIDYRGTRMDPESKDYDGTPARAYYFNPELDRWQPLPCEVDHASRTVSFEVEHFSRYGLTDAVLNGEWQWDRSGRPGTGFTDGSRR